MNKRNLFLRSFLGLLLAIMMVVGLVPQTNITAYAKTTNNNKELNWVAEPDIPADTAILMDAATGEILYEKNGYKKRYPASITKIMTALLTIENCDIDDTMKIKGDAFTPLPSGYVSFEPQKGEKMKIRDCLYALLMQSANDAGNALAVEVSGSIKDFAKRMTQRAKELGAKNTTFTNPSGLAEDTHYTCAYDMALIMQECIKHEEFITIASDVEHTIPATNKHSARYLASHVQPLLKNSAFYNAEVFCGKTGFTTPSKYTMVTAAERNGRRLICVVLNCNTEYDRCISTSMLYEYGFAYEKTDISNPEWMTLKLETKNAGLNSLMNNENFERQIVSCSDVRIPVGGKLSDLDVKISKVSTRKLEDGEDLAKGAIVIKLKLSHDKISLGTATIRFTPVRLLARFVDKSTSQFYWDMLMKCLYGLVGLGILLLLVLIAGMITAQRKKFMRKAEEESQKTVEEQTKNETTVEPVVVEATEETVAEEPDVTETATVETVSEEQIAEEPGAEETVTEENATAELHAEETPTEEDVTEEPPTEEADEEKTVTQEPDAEAPITQNSDEDDDTAKEPGTEEPVTAEPVAAEIAAEESASQTEAEPPKREVSILESLSRIMEDAASGENQ